MSTITSVPPLTEGSPPAVPAGPPAAGPPVAENRALGILLEGAHAGRPVHVEHIPARTGREVSWPPWVPAEIVSVFADRGIHAPWSHQAEVACHAQAGRNVIISTGVTYSTVSPASTAVSAGSR